MAVDQTQDGGPDLGAISQAWQEWGCACCGVTAEPGAELGYRIEVHHTSHHASQGGKRDTVADTLGLCGAFQNDCHGKYHRGLIMFTTNDDGTREWRERNGDVLAEWRAVRELPADWIPQPGPPWEEPDPEDSTEVSLAKPRLTSEQKPAERHASITALLRQSETTRLAATALLLYAYENRDYEALGLSWPDYYMGCGLQKTTVSKMLSVGRTYRAAWMNLPADQLNELTLERLYEASHFVASGQMTVEEALDEAVANPAYQLRAKRNGSEPSEQCSCRCPKCGREPVWHARA